MASPIEEVYAAYEEPARNLNLAVFADNPHALSAWMIVRDLMEAIKAELALREKAEPHICPLCGERCECTEPYNSEDTGCPL